MTKDIDNPRALLNQIDKELDSFFHEYSAGRGMSDVTLFILYVLWDGREGCTQSEICEMWSYPRQTVNSAIKKLERDGCVRLAALAGNEKSKGVFFTDAGRSLAARAVLPLILAENAAYASMEKDELSLLISLTRKRNRMLRRQLESLGHEESESPRHTP